MQFSHNNDIPSKLKSKLFSINLALEIVFNKLFTIQCCLVNFQANRRNHSHVRCISSQCFFFLISLKAISFAQVTFKKKEIGKEMNECKIVATHFGNWQFFYLFNRQNNLTSVKPLKDLQLGCRPTIKPTSSNRHSVRVISHMSPTTSGIVRKEKKIT